VGFVIPTKVRREATASGGTCFCSGLAPDLLSLSINAACALLKMKTFFTKFLKSNKIVSSGLAASLQIIESKELTRKF
jgi:hypothetical protein